MSRAIAVALSCLLTTTLAAAPRRRSVRPPTGIDEVRRVLLVVLENENAANAVKQPFLSSVAKRGALLNDYHALTHPSQPNYIAMAAGSAYGIANDNPVTIDVPHIGDFLQEKGEDWRVYAEKYPGGCFTGASFGQRGSGQYLRRHVPFMDFANVQDDQARCSTHIVDATQFDADLATGALPQLSLYIPDTNHDGHDTDVATADTWMQSRFGALIDDPKFMNGTTFVVVFDEGRTGGDNRVYCAFFGAGIAAGAVSSQYYDHYDLLRTFETIFHVGTLGHHDDSARPIRDVWKP